MGLLDSAGSAISGVGRGLVGGIASMAGNVDEVNPYKVDESKFTDPNLAKNQAAIQGRIAQLQNPSAAQNNTANVVNMLNARATGAAPSVAQTQLNQTTDANRRAALGMAATAAPGSNSALNLRTAVNAGTNATQQAAGQAATLRATEQTQAEQNLLSAVQTQAGQEQVQQQFIQQYMSMGMSLDQAQFQAQQDLEKLKTSAYYGGAGLNVQAQQSNQAAGMAVLGGLAQGAGAAAILSDKRAKMKVRDASKDVEDMLAHYADGGPVVASPMPAMRHLAAGGPVLGADYSNPDAIIAQALANTRSQAMPSLSPASEMQMGQAIKAAQLARSNVGSTGQTVATELSHGVRPMATGGPVAGPGGPRDDVIPAMLSNNENVWSADDVQKAGGQEGVEGLKAMLDDLHAKKFAYKGEGPGAEHVGIMAQDLERSPLGKTMVMDTPAGKTIDANMIMPAILAAAAELNRRVGKLEGTRDH